MESIALAREAVSQTLILVLQLKAANWQIYGDLSVARTRTRDG